MTLEQTLNSHSIQRHKLYIGYQSAEKDLFSLESSDGNTAILSVDKLGLTHYHRRPTIRRRLRTYAMRYMHRFFSRNLWSSQRPWEEYLRSQPLVVDHKKTSQRSHEQIKLDWLQIHCQRHIYE